MRIESKMADEVKPNDRGEPETISASEEIAY